MNQKTSFLILSIMVVSATTEAGSRYAQQRSKALAAAAAAAAQIKADADDADAASGAVDIATINADASARAASRARDRRASVGKFAADPAVDLHLRAASVDRRRADGAAVLAGHGEAAIREVADVARAAGEVSTGADLGAKIDAFNTYLAAIEPLKARQEQAGGPGKSAVIDEQLNTAKRLLVSSAPDLATNAEAAITAAAAAAVARGATVDDITEACRELETLRQTLLDLALECSPTRVGAVDTAIRNAITGLGSATKALQTAIRAGGHPATPSVKLTSADLNNGRPYIRIPRVNEVQFDRWIATIDRMFILEFAAFIKGNGNARDLDAAIGAMGALADNAKNRGMLKAIRNRARSSGLKNAYVPVDSLTADFQALLRADGRLT